MKPFLKPHIDRKSFSRIVIRQTCTVVQGKAIDGKLVKIVMPNQRMSTRTGAINLPKPKGNILKFCVCHEVLFIGHLKQRLIYENLLSLYILFLCRVQCLRDSSVSIKAG